LLFSLEKNLSKKVDTEESWENNFKMSVKMVLARAKGSALGLCWNISDNMHNSALVVGIVTKKGKQKNLNKAEDNLVDKRLLDQEVFLGLKLLEIQSPAKG
jgi:hypothetical protein